MSTATAVEAAVPAKSGKKKKLLIIVMVLVLLLAVAGGAAAFLMKKKAAAEAEAEGDGVAAEETVAPGATKPRDPNVVPVFVPLDTFTVNLADREADRYAQIGVSLELENSKAGDRIKLFMPAIRNNILMVLAHKRSSDLLERSGKEQLAAEVLRETERALGLEPALPGAAPAKADEEAARPVRAVHFSNFIIQ